jgi:putative hemolysin
MSYVQDPQWQKSWPADQTTELQPLAPEANYKEIFDELSRLPAEQHLLDHKHFSVYFGYQNQLPVTVSEIARLRELVFREHNEGSGQPLDTDSYDATYTHLFVVQRQQQKIVGAYRMGQTDRLLNDQGMDGLYLTRMFNFKADFVNQLEPCLEMGRSFLIPEYQRSFQGLYLLWRGIGAFVCKFPHYRTLYGTVSLSKLYDMKSVALMQSALITKTTKVEPKTPFDFKLHPELQDFAEQEPIKPHLTALLASIEEDGKDIPVLAKHYLKMGAKYHCLGIDSNFNDTPGLLLSVTLPEAPEKLGKLYLSDGWEAYKNHQVEKA